MSVPTITWTKAQILSFLATSTGGASEGHSWRDAGEGPDAVTIDPVAFGRRVDGLAMLAKARAEETTGAVGAQAEIAASIPELQAKIGRIEAKLALERQDQHHDYLRAAAETAAGSREGGRMKAEG